MHDIAIVTMEGEYELVCDLSNGAISNDLEQTLTLFSKLRHSLMLFISKTATDMVVVIVRQSWRVFFETQVLQASNIFTKFRRGHPLRGR